MKKLADECNFEKAQELKQRIASLDILQQEQSFSTNLTALISLLVLKSMAKLALASYLREMEKYAARKHTFLKIIY